MTWADVGAIVVGYALGCVASAYYYVRWTTGKDIRQLGSGNVGARNTGRFFGPRAFLIVTGCDMGKAAAACLLAYAVGAPEWVVGATLLAVMAGHAFPIQLGFRGGKCVNCIGGGMLVYAPWGVVWFVAALGPALGLRRGLEVASGVAFGIAPIVLAVQGEPRVAWIATACAAVIALLFRDPLGERRRGILPALPDREGS